MNFTKPTISFSIKSSKTLVERTERTLRKLENEILLTENYKEVLFYFHILQNLVINLTKNSSKLRVFEGKGNTFILPLFWKRESYQEMNGLRFEFVNKTTRISPVLVKKNLTFDEDCFSTEENTFIRVQNNLYNLSPEVRKIKIEKRILPKICYNCYREIIEEKHDNTDFLYFSHSLGCF